MKIDWFKAFLVTAVIILSVALFVTTTKFDVAFQEAVDCKVETWGYEQLFLTCNENLDAFIDLSNACYDRMDLFCEGCAE